MVAEEPQGLRIGTSDRASEPRLRSGAIADVAMHLDALDAGSVFCVLDAVAYERSGASSVIEPVLASREVHRHTDFEPNPKIEDIERAVAVFRAGRYDAVLAIGGGTALDLAKVIGTCGANDVDPRACVLGQATLLVDGPPMVAVPTTAGTGSEATHFAVVYVAGAKYSLAHAFLRPDIVILDPDLSHSVPPAMSAATGLDTLCQGIESMWAVGSTEASRAHAARAIRLAVAHLPNVAREAPSFAARTAMLEAAYLSGRAIDIGKTTAPHAVSYALSSDHGVSHGAAVALTLGAFLEYNALVDDETCADPRGPAHVRRMLADVIEMLGARSAEEASAGFESLVRSLGCPTRLRDVGVRQSDIAQIAQRVNVERLDNNPRRIDASALADLLRSVF